MQLTTEHLIKLGEALKSLPTLAKRDIANYLYLSTTDFDTFCDQISEACTKEDLIEDFEQKVEQYLTEQFFDAIMEWQKTILTAVLSNFTGLDAGLLNECLNDTELAIVAHKLNIPDEVIKDDL